MRDDWRPVVRPSIPPAFWLAAGVWAGAALAGEVWWRAYAGASFLSHLPLATALACAVLALVRGSSARRLLSAGLALGLVAASLHGGWWRGQAAALAGQAVCGVRGVVTEDAEVSRGSAVLRVRLDSGAIVSLGWPAGTVVPAAGQVVSGRARLKPLDPAEGWSRRAAARGIVAQGRVWGARVEGWPTGMRGVLMRRRARLARLLAGIDGDGGRLLEAVLLGDRRSVAGSPMEEDLRAAGLSHLLAASAIYAGALAVAMVALGRRLRLARWSQVSLALAVAIAYAAVTGFRPSAVRALLAFSAAAASSLTGRRHDSLAGLSLGCTAIIVSSPSAATDLGLGIGAAAVTGLCLFGVLARRWASVVLPPVARRVTPAVTSATVVQLSTLPLTAPAFGVLPLAGPLGVLAAVPAATTALLLGVAGAIVSCVSEAAARPVFVLAGRLLSVVASIARALASMRLAVAVPASPWVSGVLVAAGVVLWAWWPQPMTRRRPRRVAAALSCALAAWLFLPSAPATGRLVVLDVGQADAIVVQDGGRVMLVDAGAAPGELRTALARQRVRSVDVLVLTHPHADHTGGLAAAPTPAWTGVSAASPPDVIASERVECARALGDGTPVRELRAGDSWRLGETSVRVVWPPPEHVAENTNDASVVLLLTRGTFAALLTGDAEVEPHRRIAAEGGVPPLDVLKVAHHGSSNGFDPSALSAWHPAEALVSVGAGNDFGHPHAVALAALEAVSARVRRTDIEGDLVVPMKEAARVRPPRAACATISGARALVRPAARVPTRNTFAITENDGQERPRRPEARLPHLRRGGAAARARGPPSA